jgi:hypothetical protein
LSATVDGKLILLTWDNPTAAQDHLGSSFCSSGLSYILLLETTLLTNLENLGVTLRKSTDRAPHLTGNSFCSSGPFWKQTRCQNRANIYPGLDMTSFRPQESIKIKYTSIQAVQHLICVIRFAFWQLKMLVKLNSKARKCIESIVFRTVSMFLPSPLYRIEFLEPLGFHPEKCNELRRCTARRPPGWAVRVYAPGYTTEYVRQLFQG